LKALSLLSIPINPSSDQDSYPVSGDGDRLLEISQAMVNTVLNVDVGGITCKYVPPGMQLGGWLEGGGER
jgi:hypothetical protein